MRSTTPPAILPPTSGLARSRWRRGARRYLESASLHLSPLTSGLARRGRRRSAELDGEFAFYNSRRRLRAWPGGSGGGGGGVHSWTGSFLSLPLAGAACERGSLLFIVFGSRPLLRPGNNGEGACGQRVCIPAPLATEFGLMEAWLGCYVADCA